jgi:hypothetical protein
MGVTSGEKAILWRVAAQIEIVGSRSSVGRPAKRAVSAACNAGSITPATLDATLS